MTSDYNPDKPTFENYADWYYDKVLMDLNDEGTERWYNIVTDAGCKNIQESSLWTALKRSLDDWNAAFVAENEGYQLLESSQQPQRIEKKSFRSAVNKSFRWNVRENDLWPRSPEQLPSTAPIDAEDRFQDDPQMWFGPNNWLTDFPDIFRIRLIVAYFDGVRYLADKIEKLAQQITSKPPEVEFRASPDGYHAAHIRVYHHLETLSFPEKDDVEVEVKLEIQIVTAIQESISKMLHNVYDDWRLNGPPRDWEWDHESLEFSVNYLGHTLHYLEGMIVNARNQRRNSP